MRIAEYSANGTYLNSHNLFAGNALVAKHPVQNDKVAGWGDDDAHEPRTECCPEPKRRQRDTKAQPDNCTPASGTKR